MARWWAPDPARRPETVAERKVREAMERGEFDDLPGEGKPLNLDDRDPNWWIKGLLEREQIRMPLPTSLQLRREAKEIDETVAGCRDEAGVRDVVDELNLRILDSHRRRVDGPPVVTAALDVDAVVERWRERRATRETHPQVGDVHPGADAPGGPAGDAGVMELSPTRPLLSRPLAVGLRLVLWPLLVEVLASVSARSQDDALGAGFLAFFVIAVLAFGLALLDGLVLRIRPMVLVWSVVTVVVSVLVSFQPTIDGLVDGDGRAALSESLRVNAADLPSSFLFLLVMVGVPAALGGLSGAAIRRSTGSERGRRAGSALT